MRTAQTPQGFWFTLKEAAEACGVSRDTVKRRLADGQFPGAVKDDGESGAWRIPLVDLVQAGLEPVVPGPSTPASLAVPHTASPEECRVCREKQSELDRLREQLAVAQVEAVSARELADVHAAHVRDVMALVGLTTVSAVPAPRVGA
ncbi:helix-turn-helix domain-containing protein [Blastococcus sp. SYSU DS0539]